MTDLAVLQSLTQACTRELIDWERPLWRWSAFFCCALLLVYRGCDAYTNPQFWAEDILFFNQAYADGAASLVQVYNGYHHVLLRLVAYLAVQFPLLWIPAVMNGCALLLSLLALAFLTSNLVRIPAKPLLLLVLGVAPHTGEVYGNLTNLQWFLLWGLVAGAFLVRLQHLGVFVAITIGLLLAAMSTPMTVIVVCLYWFRLLLFAVSPRFPWALPFSDVTQARQQQQRFLLLTLLLSLAALIQLLTLATNPIDLGLLETRPFHLQHAIAIMLDRTFQPLLFNSHKFITASNHWLSLAVFALLLLLACLLSWRRQQLVIYVYGLGLLFVLFQLMVIVKHENLLHLLTPYQNADRYYYPLRVLAVWIFIIVLPGDSLRILTLLWVLCTGIIGQHSFQRPALKDLDWPAQSREVEEKIERGEELWFPVNPPPWYGHIRPREPASSGEAAE